MATPFEDRLVDEVNEILGHESFVRAPIQAKLLRYLKKRTLEQNSPPVTQYDIATEALGKGEEFDESSDSYVRVQISRLRKSLATYYSMCAPRNEGCVYIKSGNYTLSLGSREIAYPELLANKSSAEPMPDVAEKFEVSDAPSSEEGSKKSLIAASLTASFAALLLYASIEPSVPSGSVSDIPIQKPKLGVSVQALSSLGKNEFSAELVDQIKDEADQRLGRSVVVMPQSSDDAADLTLNVELERTSSQSLRAIISLKEHNGTIIDQYDRELESDIRAARELIGWELAGILSPPGYVASYLAAKVAAEPRNDFECFLLVETGRSHGMSLPELLGRCQAAHPTSEYYPFLRARELFLQFQEQMVNEGELDQQSAAWVELGRLLRSYPKNPYLNALAAKALFAKGLCTEAERHAVEALQRGRDYPALEVMLLVEVDSCAPRYPGWDRPGERIESILANQHTPHALLEAYAIAGYLITSRNELIDSVPRRPFAFEGDEPSIKIADHLRRFSAGEENEPPSLLEALVWNPQSRRKLVNAAQRGEGRLAIVSR